jgi:RNA polymerase sigma-70 factor (ECF subfamily)
VSASIAAAREEFLALVAPLRPELHRYCARLTGSVIDGEDLAQEALARAFFALGTLSEPPALRPWLFRIAHHAAVDLLKSHARSRTELRPDLDPPDDPGPDPAVVRAALARFLVLPLAQRSAVILKDVLGCPLDEVADLLETTVPAVKSLLVRGRRTLAEDAPSAAPPTPEDRERLHRYAALFDAKDWDGLRDLLAADVHLDLVSKAERRGPAVGQYFARYAREAVTLRPVLLEGRPALAAHVDGADAPSYFVLLGWDGDRVRSIRDFRYTPWVAAEAEVTPLPPLPDA